MTEEPHFQFNQTLYENVIKSVDFISEKLREILFLQKLKLK